MLSLNNNLMMDISFVNYISSIIDLPKEQEERFNVLVSVSTIKKNENFVSAGQHPKVIGFVKKGLFRYYYANQKGEEFTKGFFPECTILSSYSAMIEKRPSYFSIQALEDAEIEVINYHDFLKLFGEFPGWSQFLVLMLQKGFITKETREREFLLFDAEERYRTFLSSFPGIEKRVKQHLIASYLRITPESMSRLRRKMNLLS